MTIITPLPARVPSPTRKMIVDCRGFNFDAGQSVADSLLAWVMTFPQPQAMHVYLPSSAPQVRQLQCTLQGLGCAVSRVTKLTSIRQ